VARLAARREYRVAIAYRQADKEAAGVVSSIERAGGKAKAYRADVADPQAVERLFESSDKELGPLTALVTSAGITGGTKSIMELDDRTLQDVVATNLLGTFYCVRAASRRMARSRGGAGGAIVNISSEAGRFGGNRLSAYAAAKAGVNTLIIGAARELAEEGIRVNAVSPGVIDTDQHAGEIAERNAALVQSIPMKRMGRAEEVAEAVLWLLSDEASYVTGSVLSVTGGR
jgi:NAD(P)-dependent dehydrogenase (short-subunit alcohol dehydrogenase family)